MHGARDGEEHQSPAPERGTATESSNSGRASAETLRSDSGGSTIPAMVGRSKQEKPDSDHTPRGARVRQIVARIVKTCQPIFLVGGWEALSCGAKIPPLEPDQNRPHRSSPISEPDRRACDTNSMVVVDPTPRLANDPKMVKVHLSTGAGLEIDWKDGHRSVYTFKFLRDACPCALCEDERTKAGRKAGEPEKLAPGALPMFKPAVKALAAEAVGKYALKFSWNDNHDLGLYSWAYLREVCPCAECAAKEKPVRS